MVFRSFLARWSVSLSDSLSVCSVGGGCCGVPIGLPALVSLTEVLMALFLGVRVFEYKGPEISFRSASSIF